MSVRVNGRPSGLDIRSFCVVIVAHILAHGLTAFVVTPLQAQVLPDVTSFASFAYLPHGVRILATWLLGPMAAVPLFLGAWSSVLIFDGGIPDFAMSSTILMSCLVGALSGPAAFEATRLLGRNLYARHKPGVHWGWLLAVGVLASFFNAIGQSVVFLGRIVPEASATIFAAYTIGDTMGLVVATLCLMLLFRWIRIASGKG